MNSTHAAPTTQYMLAQLAGRDFYFSRADVISAEAMAVFGDVADHGLGGIIPFRDRDGTEIPVLALDGDFVPQDSIDLARRFAVILSGEGVRFGVLCDNLITLTSTQLRLAPVPVPMRTADSPLTALVFRDNGSLGFLLDAGKVATFLGLTVMIG
jgi:hypothetical protein